MNGDEIDIGYPPDEPIYSRDEIGDEVRKNAAEGGDNGSRYTEAVSCGVGADC
jgi:hypothetical protein